MKRGTLRAADGQAWIEAVRRTTTLWERMRGLLGRPRPAPGTALLIDPCRAVHTVGMRYPLDLVFLDAEWRVVRHVPGVRPGRLCVGGGRRARRVVETAAGWFPPARTAAGTRLRWIPDEA